MQNQPTSNNHEWTILKLLNWTTSYLKSHHIDSPRSTAEILLAHALDLKRIDLYLQYDQPLSKNELSRFKALIKRRVKREPVAYIVGVKEFWSLELAVTKDVLIPRPETECLVEAALRLLPEDSNSCHSHTQKSILELGAGSGAVVLALASERKNHLYFASDRSIKAVELAWQNAGRHDLNGTVNLFCADWFTAVKTGCRFDIILSNPPYIPTKVIPELQPEIHIYEPVAALDGADDGLSSLKHIIFRAHEYLNSQGSLLLEIGHDQKNEVKKIVETYENYQEPCFTKDYSGKDRIVHIRKKDP
jgi:release factor glutamine methyltransferase